MKAKVKTHPKATADPMTAAVSAVSPLHMVVHHTARSFEGLKEWHDAHLEIKQPRLQEIVACMDEETKHFCDGLELSKGIAKDGFVIASQAIQLCPLLACMDDRSVARRREAIEDLISKAREVHESIKKLETSFRGVRKECNEIRERLRKLSSELEHEGKQKIMRFYWLTSIFGHQSRAVKAAQALDVDLQELLLALNKLIDFWIKLITYMEAVQVQQAQYRKQHSEFRAEECQARWKDVQDEFIKYQTAISELQDRPAYITAG